MIYSQKINRLDDSSDEEVLKIKSNRTNGSKTKSKKSALNLTSGESIDADEDDTSKGTCDKDRDEDETHVRST